MNPNNVFIIKGNLTKAPILRETETGRHYAFLNLAVNNGYGKEAKPDYLSVAVWGKQAENCAKYLVKGQEVSVSGSVATAMGKDRQLHMRLNAQDVDFGRKPQISKEKEQVTEKTEAAVEEPTPIEPPEEFFSEEPSEEPDMDI